MAVINKATELTGVAYGDAHASDVSLRVVTDHMRTSVMLIGDGVTPRQRGPRLRAAPHHAPRHPATCACFGATRPVVKDLVDVVIGMMGQQYPELITDRERIEKVALGRGERLPQDAEGRHQHPRHRRQRHQGLRRHRPRRRQGLPAPRHLGASRSTSPWRWPPSRGSPWTRTASAA
ncbi:hypothetical protein GCM10023238_27610 [Streptomyces heliomycini]